MEAEKGGREREKVHVPIRWFTLQMPTTAGVRPRPKLGDKNSILAACPACMGQELESGAGAKHQVQALWYGRQTS